MKKFKTLFLFLCVGITANATNLNTQESFNQPKYDGKASIFIEDGVEFSVFPDGQFDFVYVGAENNAQITLSSPSVFLSFNSGHDYEAYVQYDEYGAIVQIEDVPVFYDEYGRIIQAGKVDISYRNRRLARVGGLRIFYNNYGYYEYCTGFINPFNRFYIYRTWHAYYTRPAYSNCIVWDVPYRRYYTPVRYSYYNHVRFYNNRYISPYVNARRNFYTPGSRIHYRNGRTELNRDYRRGSINTMVNTHGRSNTSRNNSRIAARKTRGNSKATATKRTTRNVSNKKRPAKRRALASRQETKTTKARPGQIRRNTRAVARTNSSVTSNRKTHASSAKRTKERSVSKNKVSSNTRSTTPNKRRGQQ
jgi:hypothetical protein